MCVKKMRIAAELQDLRSSLEQGIHFKAQFICFMISLIVILQYNNIMGLTKTELFTDEQNKIAAIAKVLGHPARVAILQHLLKVNRCICGQIVESVGLSQPTISQHLKELKNIGLIVGNIEGTSICYCIDPETYKNIKSLFNQMFSQQLNKEENCC